jgi:addiction module RelE/StbE family toxin
MVKINWTPQAKEDLQNIFDFIAKDSELYAFIQIENIIEATNTIANYPHSGKITSEANRQDIREIVEGNYRIIYRIYSEKEIDIITVHHGARILNL